MSFILRQPTKPGQSSWYFTQETEDAIIKYNNLTSLEEKSKLFEGSIYIPFYRLAENILNIYKLNYFDASPTEIIQNCVTFLYTKIHMYKPEKGKAFSYFNIITRRYLMNLNNSNYEYIKKHQSTDDYSEESEEASLLQVFNKMNKNYNEEENNIFIYTIINLTKYLEENIETLFKNTRDRNIAWAIHYILSTYNKNIELYNKKAIYILIREYSGEQTVHITKVLKKIRIIYEKIKYRLLVEKYERYQLLLGKTLNNEIDLKLII